MWWGAEMYRKQKIEQVGEDQAYVLGWPMLWEKWRSLWYILAHFLTERERQGERRKYSDKDIVRKYRGKNE